MRDRVTWGPGWYGDPTHGHAYRWWDGSQWTDRVSDGGAEQWEPAGGGLAPWGQGAARVKGGTRRSAWLIVAASVAGLALVVLFWGFALQTASSPTIVKSDFDDGTGPFATDNDPQVALDFADGGYRIRLKEGSPPQEARTPFDAQPAVRVEADATVVEASGSAAAGVGCYLGSAGDSYKLAIWNDGGEGRYGLWRTTVSQGETENLPLKTGDAAVNENGRVNHVELQCLGGGNGATRLVGSVNGEVVVEFEDSEGFDQFHMAGVYAAAENPPTELLFDNFEVSKP